MGELCKDKVFWIMTAVCFFAVWFGMPFFGQKIPFAAGSFVKFYETSLQSETVLFLIPIVSVLSTGASYVKESSNGFLKLYITRTSRLDYIRRRTVLIYAGGFLPFFFAGMAAMFLCFLVCYPLEVKGGILWEDAGQAFFILLRICLTGGLMAGVSGVFAAAFCNYYMAYGLPFVCYYFLVILKERYLQDMYAMYPAEWILPDGNWGMDQLGIWFFFLAFTAAVLLLHGLVLYRRLYEI